MWWTVKFPAHRFPEFFPVFQHHRLRGLGYVRISFAFLAITLVPAPKSSVPHCYALIHFCYHWSFCLTNLEPNLWLLRVPNPECSTLSITNICSSFSSLYFCLIVVVKPFMLLNRSLIINETTYQSKTVVLRGLLLSVC